VSQHAAEALIALGDAGSVSYLVAMLEEPAPTLPVKRDDGKWESSELVRVNHLRNCMLCHSASGSGSDSVRGLIPSPGYPLPVVYYEAKAAISFGPTSSTFARISP
jgi:hypothetical protein